MTTLATTLHADELAFLRAICAEPEDDTPRLVLADWYDETGEPLLCAFAAFIRQHIADLRTPPEPTTKWKSASGRGLIGREVAGKEVANDNAKKHLLASEDGGALNGHLWAYRLFGGIVQFGEMRPMPMMGTGWHRPLMWERGFPAVAKFPSLLAWKRASEVEKEEDKIYLRVPVVRTKVNGRRPRMSPYLIAREGSLHAECWYWNNEKMTTGRRDPSDLPHLVHHYLFQKNRFETEADALAAVELAFTDAGRVTCGLLPRHWKPISPNDKHKDPQP